MKERDEEGESEGGRHRKRGRERETERKRGREMERGGVRPLVKSTVYSPLEWGLVVRSG